LGDRPLTFRRGHRFGRDFGGDGAALGRGPLRGFAGETLSFGACAAPRELPPLHAQAPRSRLRSLLRDGHDLFPVGGDAGSGGAAMAVSNAPETPGTPEASKPAVATSAQSRPAPGWVLGLYLGGLALVYGGERVLSELEKGAGAVTVLGLLLALAATGLRFAPRFRVGGERKSIETLLAILSVTGLVGLAVYFLTSGPGAEKLGLDTMPVDERESIVEIARVVWASLIVLSTVP